MTNAPSRLPRALRPFAGLRYRLLASALALSLFGGGVWLVTLVASVWALGGTPTDLSFIMTGNAIGMVVAVLFGGALADRVPQQAILVVVESARIVVSVTVGLLAATGLLQVWHLAVFGVVIGLVEGVFYPAYSALLPRIVPPEHLLAANGIEGTLRPLAYQAAGPAIGGLVLAATSPAVAFWVVSASQALALALLLVLRHRGTGEHVPDADAGRADRGGIFGDIGRGFAYMVRTPWLLGTLLYASAVILLMIGPLEVLLPFAVRDQAGGGAAEFAFVLAGFGVGSAVGSLTVASLRLPRRYLTVMNLLWCFGLIPMALLGVLDSLWAMFAVTFVVGALSDAAGVIWGTILQRRVPTEMLGRVSSLDFFVSLALMPVSMALAGPIGEAVGFPTVFLVAGIAPIVLGTVAILAFRMPRDEIAHPLSNDAIDPESQETLGPVPPIHG
ncbi:MAG: MFS transporter [Microbacteriaceae bacterium]|nr:MFS transporter [Microbacteriaceae bacterium]